MGLWPSVRPFWWGGASLCGRKGRQGLGNDDFGKRHVSMFAIRKSVLCVQGGVLKGDMKDILLLDVTPLSLGEWDLVMREGLGKVG